MILSLTNSFFNESFSYINEEEDFYVVIISPISLVYNESLCHWYNVNISLFYQKVQGLVLVYRLSVWNLVFP